MTEDKSIIDLVKDSQGEGTFPQRPEQEENNAQIPQQETPEPPAQMSAADAGTRRKVAQFETNLPADEGMNAALDLLLAKVKDKQAWLTVQLPSRGLLYPEGNETVEIRPFTFADERELKGGGADAGATIERLLRRCIKGMDPAVLTPADRLYVLFRARGISYGNEYPIDSTCDCGVTNKLTLKIDSLETTTLTEEMMRFVLPDSEQEVIIKLPTQKDSHLYSTGDKLMLNMHKFVARVGNVSDPTIIDQFIRNTTVRDIDRLRKAIFLPEYGMEQEFWYSCGECGSRVGADISLNEHFFTAS